MLLQRTGLLKVGDSLYLGNTTSTHNFTTNRYQYLNGKFYSTSTLHVGGSFASAYVAKTANYTATSSDYTINVTSNSPTITLPTAVGITGRIYVIKNSGTGSVSVATTSSQTIDASTTYTLGTQYKYVTVQSNGAGWIITGNN